MEVQEVTIPFREFPENHTFGPVTVESPWIESADSSREVPVTFAPRRYRFLGIIWYAETYRTRGVFSVKGDQIALQPTAPTFVERTAWWRRVGYWLLARLSRTRSTEPRDGLVISPAASAKSGMQLERDQRH
jgi:hypothetical protein